MGENIRLTIGEFSRFCQVTVKTLRHYERMKLLVPHEVDEWTGYRYYIVSQMQQLNAILRLKEMGFSLEDVRDLFDEGTHQPSMLPIYSFNVEYEKEYKAEDIDIEYCEQVEEMMPNTELITFKRLPAIPKAVCMKCYGPYRFYQHFAEILRYIDENGYRVSGLYRTQYVEGLYCAACRKYRNDKCPGCQNHEEWPSGWLKRCSIRKCCFGHDQHTCADCPLDVGHCLIYNSFISRVFGYLFNSDRAACIRYIRRYGEQAFADRMTLNEQMTMKRKK